MEIVAILKRVVRKIRRAWPDVGIFFAGRLALRLSGGLRLLPDRESGLSPGADAESGLARSIRRSDKAAERRFLKERTPVRDFGEFPYRTKSWAEESRVVYEKLYCEP